MRLDYYQRQMKILTLKKLQESEYSLEVEKEKNGLVYEQINELLKQYRQT